jgi:5-methylcytosine-specific restriction endonuclease McrA
MVLALLKHGINLARHVVRDVGLDTKRSGKWPTVEKHFLEEHGECAACGSKTRLNVHHLKPFHLFPWLELDPTNLITLCMSMNECHLRIGHAGAFHRFTDGVKERCVEVRAGKITLVKAAELSIKHIIKQ